ncbi:MAG: hypothetical protein M3Z75_30850 [Actinomycetota bacterium]|nr:hypothetical protein [Actinomycetota bacterium]
MSRESAPTPYADHLIEAVRRLDPSQSGTELARLAAAVELARSVQPA